MSQCGPSPEASASTEIVALTSSSPRCLANGPPNPSRSARPRLAAVRGLLRARGRGGRTGCTSAGRAPHDSGEVMAGWRMPIHDPEQCVNCNPFNLGAYWREVHPRALTSFTRQLPSRYFLLRGCDDSEEGQEGTFLCQRNGL